MRKKNYLLVLTLVLLTACGKNGGGNGSGAQQESLEPVSEGTYRAILRPLNYQAAGFIPSGTATFRVKGDQFEAVTLIDDAAPVAHRQAIYMGTRCPTVADDRNGDGFVDYQEALVSVGQVLIPLDNDLDSQDAGANNYMKGSSFTYNRKTSLSRMVSDLWLADANPADEIVKLSSGDNLAINGRVVMIHGTGTNSSFPGLPASLAGASGEAPNLSLPVVCGIIRRLN